jgi:uncharacterized protein (TIGR02265 family)
MKVKGSVLVARRAFVQKHFGKDAWDRVIATLPPDEQAALKGVLLTPGWYPFKLNEHLDEAIVRTLGQGDEKVFERIGQVSADENLGGAHKDLLVPGDPQRFLANTPHIYRLYYDSGYRTYEKTGPNSATLTTYEADTFSHIDCLTIIGWHTRALEMCGAKDVRIKEDPCRARGGDVCRYQVQWRMS